MGDHGKPVWFDRQHCCCSCLSIVRWCWHICRHSDDGCIFLGQAFEVVNLYMVDWCRPDCGYWPQMFTTASVIITLQWRHNGRDGVSNHHLDYCLLNNLFRRRSKKTSKLRVTVLCAWNSPVTGEFSAQMVSNAENVTIWWRHHEFRPLWHGAMYINKRWVGRICYTIHTPTPDIYHIAVTTSGPYIQRDDHRLLFITDMVGNDR